MLVIFTLLIVLFNVKCFAGESINGISSNKKLNSDDMEIIESDDIALVCLSGGFNVLQENNYDGKLGDITLIESLMKLSLDKETVDETSSEASNDFVQKSIEKGKIAKNDQTKQKNEIISVKCSNIEQFLEQVVQLDCVSWATPNKQYKPSYLNECIENNGIITHNDSSNLEINTKTSLSTNNVVNSNSKIFNDPLIDWQWYVDQSTKKFQSVTSDAEILKAFENNCWPDNAVSDDPVVAVVDSGVDDTNPDLVNSMWRDGLKIPALQQFGGRDCGANFNPLDVNTDAEDPDYKRIVETPADTIDFFGHGTHCAGIIAAENNNNIGVCSISSNKTKIMVCKVDSGFGRISTMGVIKAFSYIKTAKENGVNVVCSSNSWGSGEYLFSNDQDVFKTLVYDLALDGVSTCFAAGNDSENLDNHPANSSIRFPYSINVGSNQANNKLSYFSNFGQKLVDVFAPGSNILSTINKIGNYEGYVKQICPFDASQEYLLHDTFDDDSKPTTTKFATSFDYKDSSSWNESNITFENGHAKLSFDGVSENNYAYVRAQIPLNESTSKWLNYIPGENSLIGFEVFDNDQLLNQNTVHVFPFSDNTLIPVNEFLGI